ncbi:MAG TPA: cbb3-type cytochrome c oxidase subunit I [Limnochordales bacterium]|nr:cbb3-type cytochrome c oxidase subunit I [Limnochordales bacterium]
MNLQPPPVAEPGTGPVPGLEEIYRADSLHIRIMIYTSFVLLAIGGFFGTLQALDKFQVDLYRFLPGNLQLYYTGLTAHGVVLALLFTGTFIIGFLSLALVHGLRRPLADRGLAWATVAVALTGALALLITIFRNQATVLFTFYAPLQAHPGFYAGLVLVALATWMAALNGWVTWRAWKRDHPNERTPLMAFAALATWAMWFLASLGLAVALLVYLLPWSMGQQAQVNPLLTRALFWFTGHPLVYFWLLPAYVSWYTMLPAQVGGRLFSESLSRLVFLLFVVLATPTGLHHMYTDPGVAHGYKVLHGVMTYAVIFPSLVTAFTVVASVEEGARRRGGRGYIMWLLALPWLSNPSVAGQLLGMLIFATGGITGLINSSLNMNLIVHNTLWVVGHLHTQVAGAVTLTFMAISYWLVPLLSGRQLWGRRWAVLQVWSWFFGTAIMARGMHWMGLASTPRRTFLTHAPYADLFGEWYWGGALTAAGGVILLLSGGLFLLVMARTALGARRTEPMAVPEAQPLHHPVIIPRWLDRISPWFALGLALAAAAWVPSLWRMAVHYPQVTGFQLW